MEQKTNQPVKINLNLGKLIDSIHVVNSPDPNVFPSPEMTSSIFENGMPRIITLSLIEALAKFEWDKIVGDAQEVNINLDQLIGMIRYDTEKAHKNEPVKVGNVELLVDAVTEPTPEKKTKSPLEVYPKSFQISEHGIRESEITKKEILQRIEEILNKVTDRDELARATIFLRLSVDLGIHRDVAQ